MTATKATMAAARITALATIPRAKAAGASAIARTMASAFRSAQNVLEPKYAI